MARIVVCILMTLICFLEAEAYTYSYRFKDTPVAKALVRFGKEHPGIDMSFIYKELEGYKTSATVQTDDAMEAICGIAGLNPISVFKKGNVFYVEALQHGRYIYEGRAIGHDKNPVEAATVMLLSPQDSTVITYGITDSKGIFTIPCDRKDIIAKFTSIGYRPLYIKPKAYDMGTIMMEEAPVRLKEIRVKGEDAALYSDKSTYRPSKFQKNASQTATELLARMAIPFLSVNIGKGEIKTSAGQDVDIYIDGVPATKDDLRMMRVSDVKTVEYMKNPADTRMQGNHYLLNFKMTQYECGGYVKALGTENFILNSGLLQANARYVRKRMTYDVMGYTSYLSNNHYGYDLKETFPNRPPSSPTKSFERMSTTDGSKTKRNNHEASLRVLYTGTNLTANNVLAIGMDDTPKEDFMGNVTYDPKIYPSGRYISRSSSKAKFAAFKGYYFLNLPHRNTLTANVNYTYSHTDQLSTYDETHFNAISNGARDDTHNANVRIQCSHAFSDRHSVSVFAHGLHERNRTDYIGSTDTIERAFTKFGQVGASYHYTGSKVSTHIGIGWNWTSSGIGPFASSFNPTTRSNHPHADASVNYAINRSNFFGASFHYSTSPLSANYRSRNVFTISPFLLQTGNPFLNAQKTFDIRAYYTLMATKDVSVSGYCSAWMVKDRAAYDYAPTYNGVVRLIEQSARRYASLRGGISASMTKMDGRLQISGRFGWLGVDNGVQYDRRYSSLDCHVQGLYYFGDFNVGAAYQSAAGTDGHNPMSGVWIRREGNLSVTAGWGNGAWNVTLSMQNLQNWSYKARHETMRSEYYRTDRWTYNPESHAHVRLSATYTFGYGKKVKAGDDLQKEGGGSSGILK